MQRKDITIPILMAATYFLSVFIAATALIPLDLAMIIAWAIVILALLALQWLRSIEQDESGAPMGCLILLPLLCLFMGILWRLARWLGLLWGF